MKKIFKMSKKSLILVIAGVIIIVAGISIVNSHSNFEGYRLRIGYINFDSIPQTDVNLSTVIKTYSELQEYCDAFNSEIYNSGKQERIIKTHRMDKLLNTYNKEFFETKSLALDYYVLSSGSYHVDFIKAIKRNNSVEIITKKDTSSQTHTDDLEGDLIVVEVDKDITEIYYPKK